MKKDDPFKALKEAMKDGKERWGKIEKIASTLKDDPNYVDMADLLVLLVEHLRPLYSAQDQNIDFDKILNTLLKK
jgi:two-component sensor histidine kinase